LAVSLQALQANKPVIWVPKEGARRALIEVLYELREKYAILWYHWPFDGYTNQDYEPVILFFRSNDLVAIGIRPHTRYKRSTRWLTEIDRPRIIFVTPWHGPMIPTGGPEDIIATAFSQPRISEKNVEYEITQGSPPEWFIADGSVQSVYDYADSIVTELGL